MRTQVVARHRPVPRHATQGCKYGHYVRNKYGRHLRCTREADSIRGWPASNLPGNFGPATDLDVLSGAAGDDTILAGAGDDTLYGGQRADTLTGGCGDDLFVVEVDGGADTVEGGGGLDCLNLERNGSTLELALSILTPFATQNLADGTRISGIARPAAPETIPFPVA